MPFVVQQPKSVRCNTDKPSPYLVESLPLIEHLKGGPTLDIGCGNGRNIRFLHSQDFKRLLGIEHKEYSNDFSTIMQLNLETESIKKMHWHDTGVALFLCNYVFMFITQEARKRVIEDMTEMACDGAMAVVEFYDAKQARYPYNEDLMFDIFLQNGWAPVDKRKERFIVKLEDEFNIHDSE